MQLIQTFTFKLLIFSLLLGAIFFFAEPYLPPKVMMPKFWIAQLVLILITLFFHIGLFRAGQKSNQAFIRFFMGATGIKLFILMTVMIGYSLFNKESAFAFILHFFIFYILYTVFEVTLIYKKLSFKNQS